MYELRYKMHRTKATRNLHLYRLLPLTWAYGAKWSKVGFCENLLRPLSGISHKALSSIRYTVRCTTVYNNDSSLFFFLFPSFYSPSSMSKWYVAFLPSSTQASRVSRIRASPQASLKLQQNRDNYQLKESRQGLPNLKSLAKIFRVCRL